MSIVTGTEKYRNKPKHPGRMLTGMFWQDLQMPSRKVVPLSGRREANFFMGVLETSPG